MIFEYRFDSLKMLGSQGPAFLFGGFSSHSPRNLNYYKKYL
jgi:hypothetical protein